MFQDNITITEPQQRRPRRSKRKWPKWLFKLIIRWAFFSGPLIYRTLRFIARIIGESSE